MKRIVLFILTLLAACTRGKPEPTICANFFLLIPWENPNDPTRADMPDETRITDWNLLIFNAFGDLEEHVYVPSRALGTLSYTTRLLRDIPYTIIATANMGYQLPIHCLSDAREYRYPLAYPDEFTGGIPMAVVLENVVVAEQMDLRLERLMARVDLRVDLQGLDSDVLVKVTDVSIGNCPSAVSLFPGSVAESFFTQGFSRHLPDGPADIVSLYLLENCSEERESFIEIKAEYHSEEYHTAPGERITYRVPLGEVMRNRVYPITAVIDK